MYNITIDGEKKNKQLRTDSLQYVQILKAMFSKKNTEMLRNLYNR